ncbi:MAG: hypothetical protein WCD20_14890 [Rhodomicrobium sp.]
MRSLSLKMGLLLALIPAGASVAAEPQQDDKSYLPPASLRAAPNTQEAEHRRQAAAEPERRHARMHRRHEPRSYRGPAFRRYAGPGYFFGMF